LYRSYPPQPDVPRPQYLLPSAAAAANAAKLAEELNSDETWSDSLLAEKEAEGKATKTNCPESVVELMEALPLVSRSRQVVRQVEAGETSRYGITLQSCHILCSIWSLTFCVAALPSPSAER